MNKYKVFENKDQKYGKRVIALEVGWSFYALIFGPIWAGLKNLNSHWIISSLLIMAAAIYHSQILALIVWIVTGFILAFLGNEIRATKLEEKSYKLVDTLEANSPENAQNQYLSNQQKDELAKHIERDELAEAKKEEEELAKAKKEEEQRNLIKASIKSEVEEKLDKVKQSDDTKDYIEKLKEARILLVDKAITLEEYEKIKQKIMSEI